MTIGKYSVRVTEIGEFIQHKQCDRRFKLEINDRKIAKQIPLGGRFFNPIDPVLQAAGKLKEDALSKELETANFTHVTKDQYDPDHQPRPQYPTWNNFVDALASLSVGQNAFSREVQVGSDIGQFHIEGRIDFILVLWKDGHPRLRVIEAKASRKDKTYHRIQVTLYRILIRQLICDNPVFVGGQQIVSDEIECSVIRINEKLNKMQSILNTLHLGVLSQEETDINRLLSSEGPLIHIIKSTLNDLDYRLEGKCDNCVFDTHCLPESSLHRRLELLNVEPSDIRVLKENGIQTIDDLADLDLQSLQARNIQVNPSFSKNLGILITKAKSRRSTLPRDSGKPKGYQVEQLPYKGYGQLPAHTINDEPLIRIFFALDYDYVEDRIVSLSAHVTSSINEIKTVAFRRDDKSWYFDPTVYETDKNGVRTPLVDKPVIRFIKEEWTGKYSVDSKSERQLILNFFHELVDKIAEVANGRDSAPIHFYVWSRQEITHLIEACSRVDTSLLSHLNELFGSRESIDQLIFSCLRDEIDQKYGLGWTGRGLSVATSLSWYGKRYHWNRTVNGQNVWLKRAFTQDVFDFKTSLCYRDDQTWEANPDSNDPNVHTHVFELRSRFNDSLTVPYWHAIWGSLPDLDDPTLNPRTKQAIRRYNRACVPGYIDAFLEARVHSLRWLEEKIITKNYDIKKTPLVIDNLPRFTLDVTNTSQAAVNFMRLENHIKRTDWIAHHLIPPTSRVNSGETIPVTDIVRLSDGQVFAKIDLIGYSFDINRLQVSSAFDEGSYVRLTPSGQDPTQGQRLSQLINKGWTCVIKRIDWELGEIALSPIPGKFESRYILPSHAFGNPEFNFATIDSSITDFVARRVDEHLSNMPNLPIYAWFDPKNPQVPEQNQLEEDEIEVCRKILSNFVLSSDDHLDDNQKEAIIEGLNSRIQLLQGPPGTGKTVTTAIAILLRILARRNKGDIVLISATTHAALNNLLKRLSEFLEQFSWLCDKQYCNLPRISIAKVYSSDPEDIDRGLEEIENFGAGQARSYVRRLTEDRVAIIGGTTSALLKMHKTLIQGAQFRDGFSASALIVDEASMMIFPHFLALSSLVSPRGEIMLTGDHRQLAPIVSHDWENEDRPPVIVYKPYRSAYEVIRDMAQRVNLVNSVRESALTFTFRLPPPLVNLIQRLYSLDDIDLQGVPRPTEIIDASKGGNSWNRIWQGNCGVFLVLHSERQSQKNNPLEAEIIKNIIDAGLPLPTDSVAVVTPHRAQRSLLKTRLKEHYEEVDAPIGIIDTVERLQGDERSNIILSATESDPSYISSNVAFILDLNRSNVAFSRAKDRLVVVCSETLINHIPADYDQYESTMLWKALRNVCSQLVANIEVQGKKVKIFTFQPPSQDCSSGGSKE